MAARPSSTPGRRALDLLRTTPPELLGTLVLLVAVLAALAWANLAPAGYDGAWRTPLTVELGGAGFGFDLRHWINDGLMALFFAYIALEVRREVELGELRDRRRALVPLVAALLGLVLPAGIYLLLNAGTPGSPGWGIAISTDTAFVLGVLAVLGARVPPALRLFVVTFAVADDIGAIAIIAVFYTETLRPVPLLIAALVLGVMVLLRAAGGWSAPTYAVLAALVWVAIVASGLHATLAGVAVAFVLPIFAARTEAVRDADRGTRAFSQSPSARSAQRATRQLTRAISLNERAHAALAPYVTFLVLPLFALANAGVVLSADSLALALRSPVTWGVLVGALVGKVLAVGTVGAVATRLAPAALGAGVHLGHLLGTGALSAMGFTLSLFIADLAFDDPALLADAQIGVLASSLLAALLGGAVLLLVGRRAGGPGDDALPRPVDPRRDHVLGHPDAALVLVEYGAYGSEACARFADVVPELRARLGEEICVVFRHVPGDAASQDAARAAESAAAQGRFWPFHDALVRAGDQPHLLRRAAGEARLNFRRFEEDRRATWTLHRVRDDLEDVPAPEREDAPVLFVQGRRYRGPRDTDSVAAALDLVRGAGG